LEELHRLAEQGHDESQFTLGYMYATGKGTVKDVHSAKAWLENAAMANNPRAQYYLGELYNEAGKNDPRAAYAQMAYWWGKSAGHPYWETIEGYDGRAISMRRLAWLHMHSDFESADPEDALRLLEMLTTKFSSPRSAIELGIVYSAGSFMPLSKRLGGTPIEQDSIKGIRLIERGVLIIENGSNDIDYNLYSAIGDTYLRRDGDAIAAEALHKGIIYKRKAYDRAIRVNSDAAYDLQHQITTLENRQGAVRAVAPPPSPQPPTPAPPPSAMEATPVAELDSELAAKFAKFTEYFDGLEIEDKRDFIKNLDQKLQENPNPDYSAFLIQCVEKYKIASQGIGVHGHEAAPPQFGGDNTGHAQGASQEAQAAADPNQTAFQETTPETQHQGEYYQDDSSAQDYDDYDEDRPHPLGIYTDRIHNFGVSSPFMIGAILYTIGGLMLPIILGIYIDHSLGFLGFGAVLFSAPPVIALWMIYIGSKSPKPPEKSLTALTLFRLTFFLHLGVIAAIAAGMALMFGMDGQALFGLSVFDSPLHLVLILVGLAVVVLYVTFYYGSLFSILKGIRDNIYSNAFEPLTGLGPFNGIHNIVSVIVIIGSIIAITVGLTPLDFITIPEIITQWFENANFALALIAVSLVITRIGGLISISVLRQFNSGLEYELEESEELEEYS